MREGSTCGKVSLRAPWLLGTKNGDGSAVPLTMTVCVAVEREWAVGLDPFPFPAHKLPWPTVQWHRAPIWYRITALGHVQGTTKHPLFTASNKTLSILS